MTHVSLPHSRHTSWIGADKFGFCIVLLFFQLLLLEENDEADYLPSYTYIPRMLLPWNQPVQFISIFFITCLFTLPTPRCALALPTFLLVSARRFPTTAGLEIVRKRSYGHRNKFTHISQGPTHKADSN